jgi:hypothetical protein
VPATAATNASRVIMDKHFILSLKGWVELSVALFFGSMPFCVELDIKGSGG